MHNSNSGSVGVALVGCGRIAGHHAKAIQETPGMHLVAVCDLDYEVALKCGNLFAVPSYVDYREMIESHSEIGVIAIMTPSGMHFEQAFEMLTEHRKHVILEKPTVLKQSQLAALYDQAGLHSLRIFPIFQNRHNAAVQRVKLGLANGELGSIRVLAIRVRWCRPQRYYDLAPWRGTFALDGGALTNQGIHHIDLLRYLGGEVKSVSSKLATLRANVEVEDTAVAVFEMVNGAVGTLEITTSAEPTDYEASISVVCSDGLAQIGGVAVNELQIYTPEPDDGALASEDFSTSVYGNGHKKIYSEISQCLAIDQEFSVSAEDVTATITFLNALYASDELQRWVEIQENLESVRLGKDNTELRSLYRLH
jgi:UDP-N-acetyl-2-amino-2-deoxyglucuronate dehydrogenase